MMKKLNICVAIICVLACLLPACSAKSPEVPQIIIETKEEINRDDYVDASIQIVDGSEQFVPVNDEEASIKIRGNSTSTADKKPYNIKFSSKTDVLGMGENKKWCLLANCYDKTLLRNVMVFDFAKMAGVPFTPDYKVVDVYVNTTYMGCYLITDAIEVSSTRVDIDTDNNEYLLELDYNPEDEDCQYFVSPVYDIKFAINEPEKEDLTEEQFVWVNNFMSEAEAALASGDYEEASKYFDMESLVNFYITLEYFKNVDVNTSSTRFHINDGKIYGGPVWDFDLSSGNAVDTYESYHNVSTSGNSYEGLWATRVPWFEQLMSYPEFETAVYSRFAELQKEIVNLYDGSFLHQDMIDYYLKTYESSIEGNHNEAGWVTDKIHHATMQLERDPSGQSYEDHVAFLREWLERRNDWLLNYWGHA